MDIFDAIKIRRSVRVFSDKAIPKEVLTQLIDAARFAPTAKNIEPWEFVVVTDSVMLGKIGELCDHGKFIANAKACIAVYCKDTPYYLEDGCAATENILLAATALGLGSCWVAGDKKIYRSAIGKLLGVHISYKLVSLIALGYPQSEGVFKLKETRRIDSMIHWEAF